MSLWVKSPVHATTWLWELQYWMLWQSLGTLWDKQHLHCVHVFAATTATWRLAFRYYVHIDRDKWYRLDHHEFHQSSSPAARVRFDYQLHNHQARWYRLNYNKSDDGSALGFDEYIYND